MRSSAMAVRLTIILLPFLFMSSESKSLRNSQPVHVPWLKPSEVPPSTEDDILFTAPALRTENSGGAWVNYSDPELLWNPSDIPFYIDHSLENYTRAIRSPIQEFERVSCIRFRELQLNESSDWPTDYIYFKNLTGCASFIGRQGGAQLISVEPETCTASGYGLVMHLIFHALGYGHEHNRPDRDKAIKIHWQMVNETKRQYLIKYNGSDAATYGESYDYNSLLHGSNYLFTIDRTQKTITARNESNLHLGQRDGFSESDIRRLNARYQCAPPTEIADLSSTTDSTVPSTTATTKTPTTRTITKASTVATTMITTKPTTPTTTVKATNDDPRCQLSGNDPKCDGETRPTLADPHDCTKYYVCQVDLSYGYQLIQLPCPEGLIYNSTIYVCDYPRNTICCSSSKASDMEGNFLFYAQNYNRTQFPSNSSINSTLS